MTFVRRLGGALAIALAMMFGSSLSAPLAQAAYTVTLQQKGSDVVATGAGTIDLTDLASPAIYTGASASMSPASGRIIIGPLAPADLAIYPGISGPTSFGSGSSEDADSGSGGLLGVLSSDSGLLLPEDYISGDTLSSTATWANQTLSSLGVAPGSYLWNWGSGADADFFRLTVIEGTTPVSEPSGVLLLALPLGFVMLGRSPRTRS